MKREKRYLLAARLLAKYILSGAVTLFMYARGNAQELVTTTPATNAFPFVTATGAASLLIDTADDALVGKAARMMQQDAGTVTGISPRLVTSLPAGNNNNVVIIGTVNKCSFLQPLINSKKIDIGQLAGKWEAFHIQVVNEPVKGIAKAACLVFMHADNVVAGQAVGIIVVMPVNGEPVAIETVQAIVGSDPYQSIAVFQYRVHGIARKTILRRECRKVNRVSLRPCIRREANNI